MLEQLRDTLQEQAASHRAVLAAKDNEHTRDEAHAVSLNELRQVHADAMRAKDEAHVAAQNAQIDAHK